MSLVRSRSAGIRSLLALAVAAAPGACSSPVVGLDGAEADASDTTGATDADSGDTTVGVDADSGDTTGDSGAPDDGPPAWAVSFDNNRFDRIIAGTQGGVLAVGTCYSEDYSGSPLPSPEGHGVCPLWLHGDGSVRWSAGFQANGEAYASGQAIAQDMDENVYLTGTFAGTLGFGGEPLVAEMPSAFLASFDATGAHRWSQSLAGWGHGVVAAGEGSLYVGVNVSDADHLALLRFDALGVEQWVKTFDGLLDGCNTGCDKTLAADAEGNVYLFGELRSTYDFGGGPLAGPDAYPPSKCSVPQPVFVVSFDRDGAHRWSLRLAPEDADRGSGCGDSLTIRSIALDGEGNVYLTGGLAGTVDFGSGPIETVSSFNSTVIFPEIYVASFTSDGAPRWSAGLGPAAMDFPTYDNMGRSIAVDAAGTVHVCVRVETGVFDLGDGTALEEPATVLVSFDPEGTRLDTAAFAEVQGYTIATGIDGAVYLAGDYTGPVELGPSQLPGPGGAFLAKLPPS